MPNFNDEKSDDPAPKTKGFDRTSTTTTVEYPSGGGGGRRRTKISKKSRKSRKHLKMKYRKTKSRRH